MGVIDTLCKIKVQVARAELRDECYRNADMMASVDNQWGYCDHVTTEERIAFATAERALGDRVLSGEDDTLHTIQGILYKVTGKSCAILP